MKEKNYLYKGKEYSESFLREKYGDDFEKAISSGIFQEVISNQENKDVNYPENSDEGKNEEKIPVSKPKEKKDENIFTYNNKEFSESELRDKYGSSFDKAINSGVFKKKEVSQKESKTPSEPLQESGLSAESDEPISAIKNKEFTTDMQLFQMESQIKKLDEDISKIPSYSAVKMGMYDSMTPQELENKNKKYELSQQKKALEKQYIKAKTNNSDIAAYNNGKRYYFNGEQLSNSEFFSKIQSNEFEDILNNNSDFTVKIDNDEYMQSILNTQLEAAKRSEGERLVSEVGATVASIFDNPIKTKLAEALSLVTEPETSAKIISAITQDPKSMAAYQIAEEKAKESGEDVEDVYLREYYNQLDREVQEIRGLQIANQEDIIDRLEDGDITGFIKGAAKLAFVSSPYLLAMSAPIVGIPLVANSSQTNTYYDLRNQGVSKEKASVASGLTGAIEVGDAIITRGLFKNSLKTALKTVDKAKLRIGMTPEMEREVKGKILNNMLQEPSTEFGQEFGVTIIDQWAKGQELDLGTALRNGAIGLASSMPTTVVMSSIPAAKYLYTKYDDGKTRSKLEKAILEVITPLGGIKNKAERDALKKEAKSMVSSYIDIVNKAEEAAAKATKVEDAIVKDLNVQEMTLERALESDKITKDTKDLIREKLDNIRQTKDEMIDFIEKRGLFDTEEKPTFKRDQPVVVEGDTPSQLEGIEPILSQTVRINGEDVQRNIYYAGDLIDAGLANESKSELSKEGKKTGAQQDQSSSQSAESATAQKQEATSQENLKEESDAIQIEETEGVPKDKQAQDIQEVGQEVREESEKEITASKERVNREIDGIVDKVKKRGVKEDTSPNKIAEAVLPYLQGSKIFEQMDDVQRDAFYKEVLIKVGIDVKKAPSINKLFKKPKEKTKPFTTKQLLKITEEQDKKGIREGQKRERGKFDNFAKKIKESLASIPKGILTLTQATQLTKAAANVKTPSSLRRFEQTADRIINNAEYALKLKEAQKVQSIISKKSRQKAYPSNITKMMADFANINPSLVPDIDQYLFYANEVLSTLVKPTKKNIDSGKYKSISTDEIYSEYIDRYNSVSQEDLKQDMLYDYAELVELGILDKSLSISEIKEIVESIYDEKKEDKGKGSDDRLQSLKKLVDYKIIELKNTPKKNLTDKAKEQLDIIENADIEGANLSASELGELYLYIQNYLQNGKLNNVSSITSKLAANDAITKYLAKGDIPRKILDGIRGAAFGLMNITQLLESITSSQKVAADLYKTTFLYEFAEKKAKAQNKLSEKNKELNKKFNKLKESHSTTDKADRMIYSFLSQVPQEDYADALDYIDSSIAYYENGDAGFESKEVGAKARELFNSKYKGTNNIGEVSISKNNQSMIDWMRNLFAEIKDEYFENAEISHNRTLEETSKDGTYLPFISRRKRTGSKENVVDETLSNPAKFLENVILPNKSGSTNKRKNVFNSKDRFMPLDFESEMMRVYESNIMDIETSFTIKKIAAFFRNQNSVDTFGDYNFHNSFLKRTKEYVNTSWADSDLGSYEREAFKVFSFLTSLSTRVALGGVKQVLQQTVPVLVNTGVVLGSPKKMADGLMDRVSNDFAKKTYEGTPVSRRSFSEQDTRKIYANIPERTKETFIGRLIAGFNLTEKQAEKVMLYFIQEGDKLAAQASWLAYYKDFLGNDFKGWEEESKGRNQEAAAYADLMINNTQNVNDIDIQADWIKPKQGDAGKRYLGLVRAAEFPFVSFALNQSMDIMVQFSKLRTKPNEALRRLGGRLAEQFTYISMRYIIHALFGGIATGLLRLYGIDTEDEETDWEKELYGIIASSIIQFTPFMGIFDDMNGTVSESLNKFYFNNMPEEKRKEYTGKSDKLLSKLKPKERDKILSKAFERFSRSDAPLFVPSKTYDEFDMGALGIGAQNHLNDISLVKKALEANRDDGKIMYEYETKKGDVIEIDLKENEQDALILFAIMESSDISVPNDVAAIGRKAKTKIFNKKFEELFKNKKENNAYNAKFKIKY